LNLSHKDALYSFFPSLINIVNALINIVNLLIDIFNFNATMQIVNSIDDWNLEQEYYDYQI